MRVNFSFINKKNLDYGFKTFLLYDKTSHQLTGMVVSSVTWQKEVVGFDCMFFYCLHGSPPGSLASSPRHR